MTNAENDAYCTCGPNGTPDECAAELAAGGWCPRPRDLRHVRGCAAGVAPSARCTCATPPEVPAPGEDGVPDHLWSPHCEEGCCL